MIRLGLQQVRLHHDFIARKLLHSKLASPSEGAGRVTAPRSRYASHGAIQLAYFILTVSGFHCLDQPLGAAVLRRALLRRVEGTVARYRSAVHAPAIFILVEPAHAMH